MPHFQRQAMPYADKAKRSQMQTARRRAKRAALIDLVGGYCRICLYPGQPCELDFHHHDRKAFGLQMCHMSKPWAEILAEAEKCVLLCKGCHALVHTTV